MIKKFIKKIIYPKRGKNNEKKEKKMKREKRIYGKLNDSLKKKRR